MSVVMLQLITIVSTCAGIATTVFAFVQTYRLHGARWSIVQLKNEVTAAKHAHRFHRCHEHDSIAIGGSDERSQDLTDIRRRYERQFKERWD